MGDTVTYAHKKTVSDDENKCGNLPCKKLEDDSTCYVKYSIGEDWGVLSHLTFPCKGDEKEDAMKSALKRAKDSLSKYSSSAQTVITETEFNSKHVPALAGSV